MANLIIKPTSGGSLILQDEGGTAANTIDASGNTQLAGTLGVTGNATLSGTGNVYGTGTFPAGHVIQTKVTTINLTNDDSNDCTTNAYAGSVINNGTSNLQVTGFSMAAGNLLKVDYSAGMIDAVGGSTNGMFGVKVDTQMHLCNFKQGQDKQTCTVNWAKVISGGLSSKTIAAWFAATGGATMGIYCHEYSGQGHDSIWSITVQEIQM